MKKLFYSPREYLTLIKISLVCFIIGYVTNSFFYVVGLDIATVRLAVGFALGVILLWGYKFWPAIFFGITGSRLMLGYSLSGAVIVAIGICLGAIIGRWLQNKYKKFDSTIPSFMSLAELMTIAGLACASISALTDTVAMLGIGSNSTSTYIGNFVKWWMADVLGILLITPLMLVWNTLPKNWFKGADLLKVTAYLFLTFIAGQIIFLGWFNEYLGEIALGYWMFLFVVIGAAKFGFHSVVIVIIMTAIQAFVGASLGVGFFGHDIERSHLVNIWFYLLCLSNVGMGLAATVNSFHKAQEEITRLAHYDSLTNLANRLLLTDRIEQAISIAKRKNEKLALILHDLDEFKPVNDNYGHRVGDLLLRKVAERIKTCIRESDTAGRIGGDEFVIIMPEISHAQDALIVANKIHDALNQPFEIGAITINISTSIGIAIYPDHGLSEEELMVNADNAMYSVKQSGRNTIKIYSPDTKLETNEARRKSQISFG